MLIQCAATRTLLLVLTLSLAARAEDVVRLGNLKFAHYGAVSHMKEICPRYGIKLEERMFAKGLDIVPGILAGEIDLAASALEGAIAGRVAARPCSWWPASPRMTVRDNVAFGLQIRGDPRARSKADDLLDKLAPRGFGDRFPKNLSGGMRQRVALARCLALDAPMLLMDEPFGALDALTRRSMQDELLRIWTELKQTIVFVTHGIEESLVLADRVVVMTYRPGTVKKIIPVTLGRPRDETAPGFSSAPPCAHGAGPRGAKAP